MHGDHMPDQLLQFFRGTLPVAGEMGQVLSQADFITVDPELVQPDTLLREFRVIELRPQAVGIIIDPFAAKGEVAGWNRNDGSRLGERGDARKMTSQIRRRCGLVRAFHPSGSHEKKCERRHAEEGAGH